MAKQSPGQQWSGFFIVGVHLRSGLHRPVNHHPSMQRMRNVLSNGGGEISKLTFIRFFF